MSAPGGPAIRYDSSIAIMGGTSRKGLWEVGSTHTAFAMMGGVDIDLRQARFTTRETVIRAYAIWSGIDIYVNALHPGDRRRRRRSWVLSTRPGTR